MRALICHSFGAYDFDKVDGLCADAFAEVAGSALWLKDEEAKSMKNVKRKGRRK